MGVRVIQNREVGYASEIQRDDDDDRNAINTMKPKEDQLLGNGYQTWI